jgi:hypothetical protein
MPCIRFQVSTPNHHYRSPLDICGDVETQFQQCSSVLLDMCQLAFWIQQDNIFLLGIEYILMKFLNCLQVNKCQQDMGTASLIEFLVDNSYLGSIFFRGMNYHLYQGHKLWLMGIVYNQIGYLVQLFLRWMQHLSKFLMNMGTIGQIQIPEGNSDLLDSMHFEWQLHHCIYHRRHSRMLGN